MFPREFADFF